MLDFDLMSPEAPYWAKNGLLHCVDTVTEDEGGKVGKCLLVLEICSPEYNCDLPNSLYSCRCAGVEMAFLKVSLLYVEWGSPGGHDPGITVPLHMTKTPFQNPSPTSI